MEPKEIYRKFSEKYGTDKQIIKAIEELSELQKILCKNLIYPENLNNDYYNIIDEMADVTIMIQQLLLIFDIHQDEIYKRMKIKHDRMESML